MKPRLLINLLVFSTIAIGAIAYYLTTTGKDFFVNKMKEEIIAEAKTEIGNAYKTMQGTPETQNFIQEADKFFAEIKSKPFTFESNQFRAFMDSLRTFGSDGNLTEDENTMLIPMLKRSFTVSKEDGIKIKVD
ncbi:MAG: hypothetical protein L6Q59_03585 [Ignavibacteriaceae bacterium]|nr:hypothetical protein [Ignavibacteriaceae bacterium]